MTRTTETAIDRPGRSGLVVQTVAVVGYAAVGLARGVFAALGPVGQGVHERCTRPRPAVRRTAPVPEVLLATENELSHQLPGPQRVRILGTSV